MPLPHKKPAAKKPVTNKPRASDMVRGVKKPSSHKKKVGY